MKPTTMANAGLPLVKLDGVEKSFGAVHALDGVALAIAPGECVGLLGASGSPGLFDDVGDAAKSMRKLADNLEVRTKEIATSVKQFTGPGLRQYEALATEGRRTLEEINRAVKSLEKNPQQLIFGAKPQVPEHSGR